MLIGFFDQEPTPDNKDRWASYCDAVFVVKSFSDTERITKLTSEFDDAYLIFIPRGSKPKGKLPDTLSAPGYTVAWYDNDDYRSYFTTIVKLSSNFHYDNEWYGATSEHLPDFSIKVTIPLSTNNGLLLAAEHLFSTRVYHQAIRYFLARAERLGFDQELYYVYLRIAQCYRNMNEYSDMMQWVNKAIELRPERNEALVLAATYYRMLPNKQKESWDYLRRTKDTTSDFYKVDNSCYCDEVLYERSIIDFYVQRDQGLKSCIRYLNSGPKFGEVYNRMTFYYENFPNTDWKRLVLDNLTESDIFTSSSISVDNDQRAIVRTVDYRIADNGRYILRNGLVSTQNYLAQWNNIERNFENLSLITIPDTLPRRDDYIKGLEDMRICNGYITATTREYSYCGWNKIVYGTIDQPEQWRVIRTPVEHTCEKNWIPLPDGRVIYKWHPYTIITIEGNTFQGWGVAKNTPTVFREYRGSSGIFKVQGRYLAIVHHVHERGDHPRQYVHSWVEFDSNYLPIAYSLPFKFINRHSIEYCLSAQSFDDENIEIFISSMDRESWHGRVAAKTVIDSLVMKI